MLRFFKKIRLLLITAACLIAFIAIEAKTESESSKSIFDKELYEYLMDNRLASLEDIADSYEIERYFYLPIAPPDPDLYLQQSSEGGLNVFNPKNFPEEFIKGLIPEEGSIPVYPITVFEDKATRNRVVLNANKETIAIIPAPSDYDPLYYIKEEFPSLWNIESWIRDSYDPARIIIHYRLIQEKDVLTYLVKTAIEAEQAEKLRKEKDSGGIIIMKAYSGPPLTNIQITAMERTTNTMQITVAYPYPDFTNKLEMFGCTNLTKYWWTPLGTTNVSASTNWVEWSDTSFSNNTTYLRFYRAGNADLDSDSDGLTDAREMMMYHSSPTNTDTDGDGLSDYNEVINLNTDPSNPDTNKPNAIILIPSNNYSWVWMP